MHTSIAMLLGGCVVVIIAKPTWHGNEARQSAYYDELYAVLPAFIDLCRSVVVALRA